MALPLISERVLQQVHEVTGRPVVVDIDPSLKLIASARVARGSAPAHLISYNPAISATADYAICFQCGFILRTFAPPADQRFDLGGSWQGRNEMEELLAEHLRQSTLSSLPEEVKSNLRDRMFDGLMRQLRSVPVGLRIDSWISAQYPELARQQRAMIERQLKENMASLGTEVRRLAPARVFDANVGMNSAYAAYWSRAWSDPTQLSPYKAVGTMADGEALLKSFDEIPADPSNDRHLIETWGDRLGLSGWFEFTPFK